jgi:hypothetical protein
LRSRVPQRQKVQSPCTAILVALRDSVSRKKPRLFRGRAEFVAFRSSICSRLLGGRRAERETISKEQGRCRK